MVGLEKNQKINKQGRGTFIWHLRVLNRYHDTSGHKILSMRPVKIGCTASPNRVIETY